MSALAGPSPLSNLKETLELGGFSFENTRRNAVLAGRGVSLPKARKTGTTIVGVVYDGGVVLGADTRATEGDTVADKNCEKIHYIAVRAPHRRPPANRDKLLADA